MLIVYVRWKICANTRVKLKIILSSSQFSNGQKGRCLALTSTHVCLMLLRAVSHVNIHGSHGRLMGMPPRNKYHTDKQNGMKTTKNINTTMTETRETGRGEGGPVRTVIVRERPQHAPTTLTFYQSVIKWLSCADCGIFVQILCHMHNMWKFASFMFYIAANTITTHRRCYKCT